MYARYEQLYTYKRFVQNLFTVQKLTQSTTKVRTLDKKFSQ